MKRIVCFLMALIMVLGMIPNTAITANAVGSQLSTSENARKIIKSNEETNFKATVKDNEIGYGTPTDDAAFQDEVKEYLNGIDTTEALDLMNAYITKVIDKAINDYTKSMNLTLTQGEHDALAVRYYNSGALNQTLLAAIRNDKKGYEVVEMFMDLHSANFTSFAAKTELTEVQKGAMNSALAEAAMFLYGAYGYNGGDKLSYALIDDDGDMVADYVIGYDLAEGYILPAAPSTSVGWYLYDTEDKTTTGAPITNLDKNTKEKLIVAKLPGDAEYTINTNTLSNLNLYHTPAVSATPKDTLKNNTSFKVTKDRLVDGEKWVFGTGINTKGQTTDTGWVFVGKSTVADEETAKPIATATVIAGDPDYVEADGTRYLPVFKGATENKDNIVSKLYKDNNVKIYAEQTESTNTGNIKWGKILLSDGENYGWINLAYTSVNESDGDDGSIIGKTGKVANAATVNIRSSAGVKDDNWITSLAAGTKVTILDTDDSTGALWAEVKWDVATKEGYTQGWIFMHYVQLDSAFEGTTGGSYDNGTVKYTGVVTSNINLNVRKYADIYAAKVDSLPHGTKINIYETATSRNMKWGRIGENQWVCLTYVALTEVAQPEGGAGSGSSTSTYVQATVKPSTLDVYKNYNANSQKVATLKKGDVATILERKTENTSTGTRIWGRIKVGEVEGWINLAYAEVKTVTTVTGGSDNTTTGSTSNSNGAAGTVANCISVNIREAAGVYNAQITKLNNGTAVKVYERVTKDGAPWARITWNNGANSGWVCMNYVTMNTLSGGTAADGTVGGTNSNTISVTGVVNSNIDLKVRSGAGLGNAQIGSLKKGTKVTVYEQVSADGMIWGRTPYGAGSGWICMSYVTVESTSTTGKGVMGTVARCFAAVNVRSAPGTNNALVNKINVGSRVEVFETKQHGTQLWGRVAQGWVCMDYILLDSELPPGTILDATVPTTEATQPGETTEPDDGLNLAGAASCSISGIANGKLTVYNEADDESQEVGSINGGKSITVVGVKKNGTEVWGAINQSGTQGWILLDNASCTFYGYVNTNKQPIYASASTGNIVGEMNIDEEQYVIKKLGTDGTTAFAWIAEKSAWIPVSKLSATAPEKQVPTYTEKVGQGDITAATTTADVTAYKAPGSTATEVFKIAKGAVAYISDIDLAGTQVWGYVVEGENKGWINLANTYFDLKVAAKDEIAIYTDRDENKPLTDKEDETVEITKSAGTIFTVRVLSFDGSGNVWAEIINTDAAVNNCFIIINTGSGANYTVDILSNVDLPV